MNVVDARQVIEFGSWLAKSSQIRFWMRYDWYIVETNSVCDPSPLGPLCASVSSEARGEYEDASNGMNRRQALGVTIELGRQYVQADKCFAERCWAESFANTYSTWWICFALASPTMIRYDLSCNE